MLDSIAKLLEVLASWRTAASLLIGSAVALAVLVGYSDRLAQASQSLGVPTHVLPAAVGIGSYSLGILCLELGTKLLTKLKRRSERLHLKRRGIEERAAVKARAAENLRRLLPDLPGEQLEILRRFRDRAVALETFQPSVKSLLGCNAIQEIHDIERHRALFKLHPHTEHVIRRFFAEERIQSIRISLSHLTAKEIEFLLLFTHPNPSDPDMPTHPWLEHATYMAGWSLGAKNLLTLRREEGSFSFVGAELNADAVEYIVEKIGAHIKRTVIELDLSNVAGVGASGSGA